MKFLIGIYPKSEEILQTEKGQKYYFSLEFLEEVKEYLNTNTHIILVKQGEFGENIGKVLSKSATIKNNQLMLYIDQVDFKKVSKSLIYNGSYMLSFSTDKGEPKLHIVQDQNTEETVYKIMSANKDTLNNLYIYVAELVR